VVFVAETASYYVQGKGGGGRFVWTLIVETLDQDRQYIAQRRIPLGICSCDYCDVPPQHGFKTWDSHLFISLHFYHCDQTKHRQVMLDWNCDQIKHRQVMLEWNFDQSK
jgi:hypothetical protein